MSDKYEADGNKDPEYSLPGPVIPQGDHYLHAAISRIETKVDNLTEAFIEYKKDYKKLEERVWSLNTSKLSTAGVVALMTVIGTITAAVGTMFPHVFGIFPGK